MATRAQIEAEVQRIVEDRVSTLDAAIVTHIQRAQKMIEDKCQFRQQWGGTFIDVVPALQLYAVPSDFISVQRAPYYLKTVTTVNEYSTRKSGTRVFLEEAASFEELMGDLHEASPPRYWKVSVDAAGTEYFEVYPRGDTSGPELGGAYRVIIPYWKRLSSLSADSSTNWFSDKLDDVLAWYAAGSLFAELRDPAANFWSARADQRLREFIRSYKRAELRQTPVDIYPSESLSSRTTRDREFNSRRIIAEIP